MRLGYRLEGQRPRPLPATPLKLAGMPPEETC